MIDSLKKSNEEKADQIMAQIKNELSKKDGCGRIGFEAVSRYGTFSVNSISEKEYQKQVQAQKYATLLGVLRPDRDRVQNSKF